MKRRVLTAEWLDKQGACEDQADLAILHFGRSVALSRMMLLECAALGLDVHWLAGRLLPYNLWDEYAAEVMWDAHAEQVADRLADLLGLPETS